MDTPSGTLESSPDPLNDSSDATVALLASSAVRRVTRSQRADSYFALEGTNSVRSASISPRKQVFRLDVGNDVTPQRLRVTVETEDRLSDSEPEGADTKTEDNVSRRLFKGTPSMPTKPTPRRRQRASSSAAPFSPVKSARKMVATTTTKIPLRGLSDDEYAGATPKRPRGRPRRSGTPLPKSTASKRVSVSPTPSTPATARTPRRSKKTGGASFEEGISATADTPLSLASGRAVPKRAARATSVDSDVDSIGGSRPRKRGRPRRLAMAPDEMAAIVEQQEDIDLATNFYASIENDEPTTTDQAPVEDASAPSPTPTTLSSVDLVKVRTPVPDFANAPAADYNEDKYLSPIQEVSGIGGNIAAIDDGDGDDTSRVSSNVNHAHAGDAAAANTDDGMEFARESIEDYDYEENEAVDNTYGDDYAAVADDHSATHNYTEDLATGNEPVPQSPSPPREESPASDVALAVETDNTSNNGETFGVGGTEVEDTSTIAETSQAVVDPRSDPTLPSGYTPANQSLHAHFAQSELTPSASDSEVDAESVGAAMASEEVYDFESEADEAATVKFRDQDTIAKGEDFSMIGVESLQTSINMSRSELPEMGETTSRIVSRSLESIRQGNQGEEEDSALSFLDFIQQSDPSTPRSMTASEHPQSAAGSSLHMYHPPQSSPTFSHMGSSKKRAEPLGKLIARKSLQQVQSPAVPRAQLESTHIESSQLDKVSYEDSFSEIPESVLAAAVPHTADTYYFSQQQADASGRVSQSQHGSQGEQPEQRDDRMEIDRRAQTDIPTSDSAPIGDEFDEPSILQSERRYERSQHTYQPTISGHDHDALHHHNSNDGDEEVEQVAADITSSPPIHLVQPQQQVTGESSHSHHSVQAETSKATPMAFMSPRQPPKAPYVGSSERVDRLTLPAESFRPSLSPIVRAGRVLQSVTSDPPSPNDNEGLLRSPFRRSITRDPNSPSVAPQNGFSSPDPEQSQASLQLTAEQSVDTPELRHQNTSTPSQPPLSASRRLWATAMAPFSGLKSLVVNGAQIISPQIHQSASAAPVVESPVTPNATKRSAEAAQLDGSDRGESSSQNKRLRLSALPEAAPVARAAAGEPGSGGETGRSWRSLVFKEGSVTGSITSFASKLISRNAQNPQNSPQNDAQPESTTPPYRSPPNVDVGRAVASDGLGLRTDEIAFSNDNEMAPPATPSEYSQHSGDASDDDDFDIWAVEASRPTPAPAARPAVPYAPPKAPETVRDPRLVRLAASQIKRSVRKQSLGASMAGSHRYGVRSEEENEGNEEFSALDTGGETQISSQPDSSSKQPAPFNLDDFFSSPVAVPRMLPPTSEKNIRLNEQSRLETLERLLEHERRRDAQQTETETGQDGYNGENQTATTADTTSATSGTQQAVQQLGHSSPTDTETVAEKRALNERQKQSGFNVAFYGKPPTSVSPPRNTAGAEEEGRREIGAGDADNSRYVRGMPRIRNIPRRRSISKSQQARMEFLRAMKEPSANSGPEKEQSPRERTPRSGGAVKGSTSNEVIPSTPLQDMQRRVALPSSSPEDEALGVHRLPYSRSNAQHVDDGADEEPPMMSSPFEEAADMPDEQSCTGDSLSRFEEPLAAASESVFFEKNLEQASVQEPGWGSREAEGQEASYVESESSFLPPVLKPLPARSASPTKSCMRSPAKAKTPGRVVEFASSTMGTDTGEQVMEERANMQQAELQFAEHFALDTENRIPAVLAPPTQSNAQATNDDDETHMMDVKEVVREEGRRGNKRGYVVDEELSEMMLSDAHQISTPLAFVYTPKVQAGRPYIHAANIPRARWQAPPAIALPPSRDWTLEDWLSMNQIVQDYRHLGPLAFHRRYMPERGNGSRSPGGTLKRPSHALYRKVVHTENEGMLIKDWHLDIVDAFYIKAGRIWNHHYLLRRLFSLFIGEARHGILPSQESGGF